MTKHPPIEEIARKEKWTPRDFGRAYLYYLADVIGRLSFMQDAGESMPPTGLITLETIGERLPHAAVRDSGHLIDTYTDAVSSLTGAINYIKQTVETLDAAIRSQKTVNIFLEHGQREAIAELVKMGDVDTLDKALSLYQGGDFARLNDMNIQESVRHIYAYNRIINAIADAHEVPHFKRLTATTRRAERAELAETRRNITSRLSGYELQGVSFLAGGGFFPSLDNYAGTEEDHKQLTRVLSDLKHVKGAGFYTVMEGIAETERTREELAAFEHALEDADIAEIVDMEQEQGRPAHGEE